ncbi:hypothetical protein B484DRAFT_110769 [Ochromonadaceae sp. CCMP2298]|nr:hypothetical protein B484DRAFT_110769 [Ochromonadaceae sp. CCMP2298]
MSGRSQRADSLVQNGSPHDEVTSSGKGGALGLFARTSLDRHSLTNHLPNPSLLGVVFGGSTPLINMRPGKQALRRHRTSTTRSSVLEVTNHIQALAAVSNAIRVCKELLFGILHIFYDSTSHSLTAHTPTPLSGYPPHTLTPPPSLSPITYTL